MAEITINSRKFDRSIYRSWSCKLLNETEDYWLFFGKFDNEVQHSKLGLIQIGTLSYEYYFRDKWFNVFRFHEPDGSFKFYYCNLNIPPEFNFPVLDFIDLDIDILVRNFNDFEILDEDEFHENSFKYDYPQSVIEKVSQNIDLLLNLIKSKTFPFEFK